MKVRANRQLTGDYGTVVAGQVFELNQDIALELLRSGVIEPYREVKVIVPEVPGERPFRLLYLPNEQAAMGGAGDSGVAKTDVPTQGTDCGSGRAPDESGSSSECADNPPRRKIIRRR